MSDRPGEPGRLADDRADLRADCARCVGLCCVAPAFAASADFAIDKPAGRACPNLGADFGCRIHDGLRDRGFAGCAVFDCFGAGQHVTQVTFGGGDWRADPAVATSMFAVFPVMRQLKELLWHLAEALARLPDGPLREEVDRAREQTRRLTGSGPDALASVDAAASRQELGPLLDRVSQTVRAEVGGPGADHRGADLIGTNLRGADLRAAGLRGAYLLGADLRGADLRFADLLSADLRAADVRAARLDGSLFLTQPQLDAAIGDASTTVPSSLRRPRHWSTSLTPAEQGARRRQRRRR